jgi:NAD-dependent SIR2 family protein deacetylase
MKHPTSGSAMLVVDSSLMVYSVFRLCERARAAGKPIAVIDRGRACVDHLFARKVEEPCDEVLVCTGGRVRLQQPSIRAIPGR